MRRNKKYSEKYLKYAKIRNKIIGSRITGVVLLLIVIFIITNSISSCVKSKNKYKEVTLQTPTIEVTNPNTSNKTLSNFNTIYQDYYSAACEIYASVSTLNYLNFDVSMDYFVENYVVTSDVVYDEDSEAYYGPDMNTCFAGDLYEGYGMTAIATQKMLNNFLQDNNSQLNATALSNVPLENLCNEYINNNVPVLLWATEFMQEPYVHKEWIVNYADENSPVKIGDTVKWQMNEHCLVLVGYDDENYYFADSLQGEITPYDKELVETRYSQLGMQALVIK